MQREIGSEFSDGSSAQGTNHYATLINYDKRYVLSGRTGLRHIADDINIKYGFHSVCLPEYCCSSMIAPFAEIGISVSFYNRNDGNNECAISEADAVLCMHYFGFISHDDIDFALKCKAMGKIVIVDATQTAFSRSRLYDIADYIVVSCRKWSDCLCAAVYCKDSFCTDAYTRYLDCYKNFWREAAKAKRDYICHGAGSKCDFLPLYKNANNLLNSNYVGYAAEDDEINRYENIDSTMFRKRRRTNAKTLLSGISSHLIGKYGIQLFAQSLQEEDCPLFVPVFLDEGIRAEVRNWMIENDIYCPIHWPVDKNHNQPRINAYKTELSLICDQRYNQKDMERELEALIQFFKQRGI